MSTQIAGIGIGSFILFSLWLFAIILCVISLRTEKIIGIIALTIATVITIILFVIPKHTENFDPLQKQESDYYFIWRNILASFLGLCSIGSIILFVTEYAVEPKKSTQIRTWIAQ